MTVAYPHVAERLFGRAHAIDPCALRAIVEGPLGRRVLSGERIEGKEAKKAGKINRDRLSTIVEANTVRSSDGIAEYALTGDGVAVLSINGALSKRYDWLAAACGWTTYDALGASLDAALSDYRVKAILLDVDSPGGEAAGMLDIADQIIAARSRLPIWAVANSFAASAAYALAGSAEKLFMPRLAQVGSIGAVIVHVDQSAQDKADGLNYSAVFSGARKIDGWGHAPLSGPARDSYQSAADHCRQAFADLVGRQGRLSSKSAMQTEAEVFYDTDAVAAKLVDGIKTFDDALAELTDLVNPSMRTSMAASAETQRTSKMSKENTAASAADTNVNPLAAVVDPTATAPAPAEAAAPEVHTAALAGMSAVAAPKPGEKCATCGQMMPNDDDDDGLPNDPNSAATDYTMATAIETMDLCAIAKVPLADAKAFVTTKTPISEVRATLARRAADTANATAVDGTAKPAGQSEAKVAAAWDEVVAEQNSKLPQKR